MLMHDVTKAHETGPEGSSGGLSAINKVPDSILFDRSTGKSELVLRDIVPTTLEVLRERLSDAIPVYSKEVDGTVHQGIRFCNTAGAPNRSPRLWCPAWW